MAKASKASRQSAGNGEKSSSDKPEGLKATIAESLSESQELGSKQGGQEQKEASALLQEDHRKVERLFKDFENSNDPRHKKDLARDICKELIIHSKLEEEIFYPACREKGVEGDDLDEAQVEHDTVKFLIGDILSREADSPFYDAKVTVLSDLVKHHVAEEEKAVSGMFAKARAAGVDMAGVGTRLQQAKERLMTESGEIEPPRMRSLRPQPGAFNRNREENDMERWNERDERGGYMGSDDDDRGFPSDRHSSAEGDDDTGGRYTRRGGYSSRDLENDRGWRGGQGQGGYRSDYRQSAGTRSSRGSGYTGQGGYEDDSRFGGSGGGGSGGYERARSGGYGGQGEYRGSRGGYGGSGEFGTGGYGGGSDDFGRSGSRSGGGSGGYATGYGGGYGSGHGGGMGGTEDEFSRGSRRDYGRGGSRGDFGRENDDYSSRGSRGRGGGFERERDEYGRFMSEYDEGRGGRGGSRGFIRERDEQGRFTGDDDNGGRGERGRSGRSQGGWFGDSRGHAEAARRGWRDRD
jgi:hemerythrin superfamily protein